MRKTMILIGLPVLLASSAACSVITGTKTYQLASPAMEPTLKRGASVTAQTVDPGDYQPAVGDIVVLDPPDTWSPANADIRSIFRVVAVPGDTIGCCDAQGRITRNGTAVDEPYVQAADAKQPPFEPVTLAPDEIYLLGDNRGAGADSSEHGPAPAGNVIGVVED